ncbi:Fe-S protein assembly co-chaperone HscB [Buchnera aphidicola]|uniref:Fe-S protein assembly co-chaperone HscB n=1 Tax=Buchnera aphidicola TaxID=9 RepID=UPI0031B8AB53
MNYFKIFNIKENFKIDYKKLSRNFYKLQKKFHPDMNIKNIKYGKTEKNKSVEINNGYKILKNPIKRAEYIIKINNLKIFKKKEICTTKFLIYIFKLNKKIEKIKKSKKYKKEKKQLLKNIKKKKHMYYKKIYINIKNKKWEKSKNILTKLKFIKKIISKIK